MKHATTTRTETESPDWVTHTPDPIETYHLAMCEDGRDAQLIAIDRDEFIALKEHLAGVRGFHIEEQWKELVKGVPGYASEGDTQQLASHLETARHFYKLFPALVTAPDDPPQMAAALGRTGTSNSSQCEATKQVRGAIRSEVQNRFNTEFMPNATPEDMYLMRDIMRGFEGISGGPDSPDVPVARAINRALSAKDEMYVAVSEQNFDHVYRYAEALNSGHRKSDRPSC